MGYLRSGYEGSGGHLEAIWGLVLEGHSGANSGPILDPFWTLSQIPHQIHENCLHLAVGSGLEAEYDEYGVREDAGGYPV